MRLKYALAVLGFAACAAAAAPATACPDLAVTSVKQVTSVPRQTPLRPGEFAFIWTVRNVGRDAYTAPNDSQQWVDFFVAPTTEALGSSVLPPSGPGGPVPVSIAPGQNIQAYFRITAPAGTPRTGVLRARLGYAARAGGDCSDANNERRAPYRLR